MRPQKGNHRLVIRPRGIRHSSVTGLGEKTARAWWGGWEKTRTQTKLAPEANDFPWRLWVKGRHQAFPVTRGGHRRLVGGMEDVGQKDCVSSGGNSCSSWAEHVEFLDIVRWTSMRGASHTVFALANNVPMVIVISCEREQSLVWLLAATMELWMKEVVHMALYSQVLCLL